VSDFTVLSLNLRFGLADDGPHGWGFRRDGVVKLFCSESPHFISVQEANHFQTDFLVKHLPGYACIGRRTPAPFFWQDNIIFFRRDIGCLEQKHFFLSETPQFPSRSYGSQFPRQGTLGLFQLHGRRVICINTHLDFETPAQMGALDVIHDQLRVFSKNEPIVLMGDFNATPESPCYKRLTGHTEGSSGEFLFQETFKAPYPSTFHRFTGTSKAGYIDWILFRNLCLKSCCVLEGTMDGVYVSDHFPVKAAFAFLDV
jgi:endonuclease/exonuclease/phosphatase family metal-dependent hydrolase